MFNYCYDSCLYNSIPRHSIVEGGQTINQATEGKDKRLTCDLGYKQTVNSYKARMNSKKNGTEVCSRLRVVHNRLN